MSKGTPKEVRLSTLTTEYHEGNQKVVMDKYKNGARVSIPIAQSLTLDQAEQIYLLLRYILIKNGKLNAQ